MQENFFRHTVVLSLDFMLFLLFNRSGSGNSEVRECTHAGKSIGWPIVHFKENINFNIVTGDEMANSIVNEYYCVL